MQLLLTTSNLTHGWNDHLSCKLGDGLERRVFSVAAWIRFVLVVETASPLCACRMLAVCLHPKREWVETQQGHDLSFYGLTRKRGGCVVVWWPFSVHLLHCLSYSCDRVALRRFFFVVHSSLYICFSFFYCLCPNLKYSIDFILLCNVECAPYSESMTMLTLQLDQFHCVFERPKSQSSVTLSVSAR